MKNIGFTIVGSGTIALTIDSKTELVNADHLNYNKIVELLKLQKYEQIPALLDVAASINSATKGIVSVANGTVYLNGIVLHNTLCDKVKAFYLAGLPYEPLVNFIRNLLDNESEDSKDQIYRFLEANNLPITPDGCMLFYKRVRNDYTDCYTGKNDNHVGCTVKMDRKNVVADPRQTCSQGLHVCSLGYLKSFQRGCKIVICKVNPANVVSVPTDYRNTKVRVCEYTVVGEWTSDEVEAFDGDLVRNSDTSKYVAPKKEAKVKNLKPVVTNSWDNSEYGVKPDGSRFHNIRGSNGKFVKKLNKPTPKVGFKPNGQKFHNVRGSDGKFAKKA